MMTKANYESHVWIWLDLVADPDLVPEAKSTTHIYNDNEKGQLCMKLDDI